MLAAPNLLTLWLSSVAASASFDAAEDASGASSPDAPDDAGECFPPCRGGYLCHKGECISACNPACGEGEVCTEAGECVEKGAPGDPAVAPVVTPAEEPAPTEPALPEEPVPSAPDDDVTADAVSADDVAADDPNPEEPPPDEPPPSEPAPPEAVPPAPPPKQPTTYKEKVAASTYDRQGLVLDFGLGIRICRTDSCRALEEFTNFDIINAGPSLRIGVTYRPIAYVSAGVETNFSLHGIGYRSEEVGSAFLFTWNIMPTVLAHPLAFSRFDPFVGFGFGFGRERKQVEAELEGAGGGSLFVRDRLKRSQIKFSGGLDVFLTDRISAGARVDWERSIRGEKCAFTELDGETIDDVCDDISNFDEESLPPFRDPVGNGSGRNWWTISLGVKVHLL